MIILGQRLAAMVATTVAFVGATLTWSAPAHAETPGFAVNVTHPGTFTIGQDALPLTAVVFTDSVQRCQQVRWALTVRTAGISLDQMKITRVENGQVFATREQFDDAGAQVVDVDVDTGRVCKGRTDTAQWAIAFAGPDDGQASFEARAFDRDGRLLAAREVDSQVVTTVANQPTDQQNDRPTQQPTDHPTQAPTENPTTLPTESFSPQPAQTAEAVPTTESSEARAADIARANGSNILGPGLIVGAVLVMLGVGLLMRLRAINRARREQAESLPTGFYTMPPQNP